MLDFCTVSDFFLYFRFRRSSSVLPFGQSTFPPGEGMRLRRQLPDKLNSPGEGATRPVFVYIKFTSEMVDFLARSVYSNIDFLWKGMIGYVQNRRSF